MKRVSKSAPVPLGRYIMHDSPICVDFDPGRNGGSECVNNWGPSAYLHMTLGMCEEWPRQFGQALHEVMELSMVLRACSYSPFESLERRDAGRFRFFFDHEQFTAVCDHAADMLAYLIPELKKSWKKSRGPLSPERKGRSMAEQEQGQQAGGEKSGAVKPARKRKASEYIVETRDPLQGDAAFVENVALGVHASPEAAADAVQEASSVSNASIQFRTVRICDEGTARPQTTATIERAKGYRRSR